MTKFDELGGQVQIPLNIGTVHNVQNGIGVFLHQILTGHQFLGRIGRQGINTRQVLNDHILIAFQIAFLFLHRNARPVANILVGPGKNIK